SVHDSIRHAGGPLCGSDRPSSPPGGADELFRTRLAAAPRLSRRDPFRPPYEDHASGVGRIMGVLARFFPRAPCRLHLIVHPCTVIAGAQLASGTAVDRALRAVWGAYRTRHAQDRVASKHGANPSLG